MTDLSYVDIIPLSDLPPGSRMSLQIDETWIVLFNVDNQLYAIDDTCSHEDYPLSDGTLVGCTIECAKHGAKFDIRDGRVLSAPAFIPIKTYPVRVENEQIQIGWQ